MAFDHYTKGDLGKQKATIMAKMGHSNGYTNDKEPRDIEELIWANGIYNRREMGLYSKFSRIPVIDPDNALINAKEYVFFTKPDLHLLNQSTGRLAHALSSSSFFMDVVDRYSDVCSQLQMSVRGIGDFSKTPFMTLLSNSIRSELQVPDLESDTDVETGANDYGTKISYRGNSISSDQEHSFSIEFEDTKFLEIYMLFKIYDEYERYKNLGMLELNSSITDDWRWINYTTKKILHDQFSIYKFIVAEDGESIIYYGKYTGVYPTGAPRDAFSSMDKQAGQAVTANFKAQFYRDMDPVILNSFNRTVSDAYGSGNNEKGFLRAYQRLPITNPDTQQFDGRWATIPHIAMINSNSKTGNMHKYKLRWYV